ncbi:hypothetical protein [Vibrio mexicanus]|uniref:hypothetical protein n=1 Tax=Vibrio mexicanus TaxID=1004326 RepID=UPI00063C3263|nr:hypothetical protein [Vibrio mexicanus]
MYGTGGEVDWTGIPDAAPDLNSQTPDTTKPRLSSRLYHLNMVPVGGLEPPRPKATDFEFSTNACIFMEKLGFKWIRAT